MLFFCHNVLWLKLVDTIVRKTMQSRNRLRINFHDNVVVDIELVFSK